MLLLRTGIWVYYNTGNLILSLLTDSLFWFAILKQYEVYRHLFVTFLNTFCKVYFSLCVATEVCVLLSLMSASDLAKISLNVWFQIAGELFLSIQTFWLIPVVKAGATQEGRNQGKHFHCSFRELPSQPKCIASNFREQGPPAYPGISQLLQELSAQWCWGMEYDAWFEHAILLTENSSDFLHETLTLL